MKSIRTKLAMAFGLLILSASASTDAKPNAKAGTADNPYSPRQAIGHQGQNVTVQGMVSRVEEADGLQGTYVWLTKPGTKLPFVGYISKDNEREFPDVEKLEGKTIDITGVVETFKSIPTIRLSDTSQVKIVD